MKTKLPYNFNCDIEATEEGLVFHNQLEYDPDGYEMTTGILAHLDSAYIVPDRGSAYIPWERVRKEFRYIPIGSAYAYVEDSKMVCGVYEDGMPEGLLRVAVFICYDAEAFEILESLIDTLGMLDDPR